MQAVEKTLDHRAGQQRQVINQRQGAGINFQRGGHGRQ
jgi:hypothetical protein